MSEFYDRMASTASRLIIKFGQKITIVRMEGESDHPITGVNTAGVKRNKRVSGILQTYPDKLIDGTQIVSSDRLLILEPKVEPEMTDKININNQGWDWDIENIKVSSPAGTPLAYFVQLRK
jgi:hypothetical protein